MNVLKKTTILLILIFCSHTVLLATHHAEKPETKPVKKENLDLTFSEDFTIDDSKKTGSITVLIDKTRNTEGIIGIALFNSDRGFPDKPEKAVAKAMIEAGECGNELVLGNIPYGTYALSILHDENRNGKMDKTWIGKPKEGFGTSNNPIIKYGPPEFDESIFIVDSETVSMTIDMNYF